MGASKEIDPALLRQLLRYDPSTGKLYWRERPLAMFAKASSPLPANQRCRSWNTRFAGREAFATINDEGYRIGRVLGVYLRAHRVVYAMLHDEWPEQIDHDNHDRADNRERNIKPATNQSNQRNVPLCRNNKSGVVGVVWVESKQHWRAQIGVNNTIRYLGTFPDKASAIAARKQAEHDLGFAPSHGAPRKRATR